MAMKCYMSSGARGGKNNRWVGYAATLLALVVLSVLASDAIALSWPGCYRGFRRIHHPPFRQLGSVVLSGTPGAVMPIEDASAVPGLLGPWIDETIGRVWEGSVNLATGSPYERSVDLVLPSTSGQPWKHIRTYGSLDNSSRDEGWNWRSEYWATWEVLGQNPQTQLVTVDQNLALKLNASGVPIHPTRFGVDPSLRKITTPGMHEVEFTTGDVGRLEYVKDDRGWGVYFCYDANGVLVRAHDADNRHIIYEYLSAGPNQGKLDRVKVYKACSQSDCTGTYCQSNSDLIAKIEFTYHDGTNHPVDAGLPGDLLLVKTSQLATGDTGGTLSIERYTHYRYWQGTYHATNNPGTDHQLKMIVRSENYQRLVDTHGSPLVPPSTGPDDAEVKAFANLYFEYENATGRVNKVIERGANCEGCGGESGSGETLLVWAEQPSSEPTNYNDIYAHVQITTPTGTTVYVDTNRIGQVINFITTANSDIWGEHYVFGEAADNAKKAQVVAAYRRGSVSSYSFDTGTYQASLGLTTYRTEYDYFNSGTLPYNGALSRTVRLEVVGGQTIEHFNWYRWYSVQNSRVQLVGQGPDSTQTNDANTIYDSYQYYSSGGTGLKQYREQAPKVTSTQNGSDVRGETSYFYDKMGQLRWVQDAEGRLTYYGYDDGEGASGEKTGKVDLIVEDVATTGSPPVVSDTDILNDWVGTTFGFGADNQVPFAGGSNALQLKTKKTYDVLGRVKKETAPDGLVTHYLYKFDGTTKQVETLVYPGWYDSGSGVYKTRLPAQISRADLDGNIEEEKSISTSKTFAASSGEPTGGDTISNSDLVGLAIRQYTLAGEVEWEREYHNIPSTLPGYSFDNYYETGYEYDSTGRLQFVIEQALKTTPYNTEQVTEFVYDPLSRVTEVKRAVSGENHQVGPSSKPTMVLIEKKYFDDNDAPVSGGVRDTTLGDSGSTAATGLLSWVERYYADGSAIKTRFGYDSQWRQVLILPDVPPYTVNKYDSRDRLIASATYDSLTGMSTSTNPMTDNDSNRLSLRTMSYDNDGRVFQSAVYADPKDNDPADALVNQHFFDRRGYSVASDPPNSGITFTKYDGLGRPIETMSGTQFAGSKYTSGVFQYPGDNSGVVEVATMTYNTAGRMTQVVRRELNHNDADGMNLSTFPGDGIRSYVYNWYDEARRLTATADYGTNSSQGWKDNSAPTYGSSAPSRSDDILVTSYEYDNASRTSKVVDPAAKETVAGYDALSRATHVKQGNGSAVELKIEYGYTGLGDIALYLADPNSDNTLANGVWTQCGSDSDQLTEYKYTDAIDASWVTEIRYPVSDGAAGTGTTDRQSFTYNRDGTVATMTDQNATVHTFTYGSLRRPEGDKVTTFASGIDQTVKSRKRTYTNAGLVDTITAYKNNDYTNTANQIKNTYNDFQLLTKVEFDHDSVVGDNSVLDTRAVEYAYATDFEATTNIEMYYRPKNLKYPNGRYIWHGYTHDGGTATFQDTVNNAFSRVGQIAEGNDTDIGNLYFQWDYNGLGRQIRRTSDYNTGTGWKGNKTRLDYWGSSQTSGQYDGLDRFGRIVDLRISEFEGSTSDLARRKYTYDRASNRKKDENLFWKLDSALYGYDDRHRLTDEDRGRVKNSDPTQLELNKLLRDFGMTDIGATTADKVNSTSDNVTHTVNSTNEITSFAVSNPAGHDLAVEDTFSSTIASGWTALAGSYVITSGKFVASTATSGVTTSAYDGAIGDSAYQLVVNAPSESSMKAGLLVAFDWDTGYAATIDALNNVFAITAVSGGGRTIGSDLVTKSVNIDYGADYTITVVKQQETITAWLGTDPDTRISYSSAAISAWGVAGVITNLLDTKLDDFRIWNGFPREMAGRRWRSSADAVLDTNPTPGELTVNGKHHGGEVVLNGHADSNYIAQADINLNSGVEGALYVRYLDPSNWGRAILDAGGIKYQVMLYGNLTTVATSTFTPGTWSTVKIKRHKTSATVWVDGTQRISTTITSDPPWGAVALSGWQAKFRNLKIGYDNNADNDIDDTGDDVVFNDDFRENSLSFDYDHNGNLTRDTDYRYTYDAWNNLMAVSAQNDTSVVVAEYRYFADDRRAARNVDYRGSLNGDRIYVYDHQEIIEERNGSEAVVEQYVFGPNHVDELLMVRGSNGTRFVYQDPNWNVLAATTSQGTLQEENVYSPYGQVVVRRQTAFGDNDVDGDVDSTDNTAWNATQGGGGVFNRHLDADWDGDNDSTDKSAFDANYLAAGDSVQVSGRSWSPSGLWFGYTGRQHDPETGLMHYRARSYHPTLKQFTQRDPIGYLDSASLYQYVSGMVFSLVDAFGLLSIPGNCGATCHPKSPNSGPSPDDLGLANSSNKPEVSTASAEDYWFLWATGGPGYVTILDPGTGQTIVIWVADITAFLAGGKAIAAWRGWQLIKIIRHPGGAPTLRILKIPKWIRIEVHRTLKRLPWWWFQPHIHLDFWASYAEVHVGAWWLEHQIAVWLAWLGLYETTQDDSLHDPYWKSRPEACQ